VQAGRDGHPVERPLNSKAPGEGGQERHGSQDGTEVPRHAEASQ